MTQLFKSLDKAEEELSKSPGPYYHGDRVTEADIRLFTVSNTRLALTLMRSLMGQTIIRFDPVYVQHFKCNLRDIRSGYPHLHKYDCPLAYVSRLDLTGDRWVRHCYWNDDAFGSTTEFEHIRNHYTKSHHQINPHSITPLGPVPNILPLDQEVAAAEAFKLK